MNDLLRSVEQAEFAFPSVGRATSELAAASTSRERAERQRRMILAHLADLPTRGATDDELELMLNVGGNTERPRRWELWQAALIEPSVLVSRPTRSGSKAAAWFITPKGRLALSSPERLPKVRRKERAA